MKPIYNKGDIRPVYRQWVNERFPYKKVVLIEFLGYIYNQGRFYKNMPKPFYSPEKEAFIAELWKCQNLQTGEFCEHKFRHPVAESREESSLTVNKNPIIDYKEVNLLTDTLEEYYRGEVCKRIYPNKQLRTVNKKFVKKLEIMDNILSSYELSQIQRIGLFLMLRHKQSPTMETFLAVKNWRLQNTEVNDQLLLLIQNYEEDQIINNSSPVINNNIEFE